MPTITCPRDETNKTLGPHEVVSAHRSRAGVVTYYRCHCGGLVLDTPSGTRHVRPDGASTLDRRPRKRPAVTARYVHHYLEILGGHAEWFSRGGGTCVLHEFVSTLVKAAAVESDAVTVVVPGPADPPVTLLRAVARLASQTAGARLPVCPALADRLDDLSQELGCNAACERRGDQD